MSSRELYEMIALLRRHFSASATPKRICCKHQHLADCEPANVYVKIGDPQHGFRCSFWFPLQVKRVPSKGKKRRPVELPVQFEAWAGSPLISQASSTSLGRHWAGPRAKQKTRRRIAASHSANRKSTNTRTHEPTHARSHSPTHTHTHTHTLARARDVVKLLGQ